MNRALVSIALPLLLVGAPAMAAPDSAFLADAMKGDNGEVSTGQLATQKAQSAKARDFGKMLVADHGAHKKKVAALAGTMGVASTDAMTPEATQTGAKLKALSGAAFDKAFKQAMIEDHQKDIVKYEEQAKSGQSAEVRRLAQETLPTLRHHLETAQAL